MRQVQISELPDGAVTINGSIAAFELPNPDNPLKPIQGSAQVVGEALHLFLTIGFFPFTRLVHLLVVPNPYLWRKTQVVRWYGQKKVI